MGYLKEERDPLWWPNSGSFEVVVGTILTQQTKWQKVERALEQLRAADLMTPEGIAEAPVRTLAQLIKPSGFYNTKAKRLQELCRDLLEMYGGFERFVEEVDREWLLQRRGLGPESADSILCYACAREVMVVDSYTTRLLEAFGYRFESYDMVQEWLQEGIASNLEPIEALYGKRMTLQQIYARFHGKIVEFAKEHIRGANVRCDALKEAIES